jgi:hypothetical protein
VGAKSERSLGGYSAAVMRDEPMTKVDVRAKAVQYVDAFCNAEACPTNETGNMLYGGRMSAAWSRDSGQYCQCDQCKVVYLDDFVASGGVLRCPTCKSAMRRGLSPAEAAKALIPEHARACI